MNKHNQSRSIMTDLPPELWLHLCSFLNLHDKDYHVVSVIKTLQALGQVTRAARAAVLVYLRDRSPLARELLFWAERLELVSYHQRLAHIISVDSTFYFKPLFAHAAPWNSMDQHSRLAQRAMVRLQWTLGAFPNPAAGRLLVRLVLLPVSKGSRWLREHVGCEDDFARYVAPVLEALRPLCPAGERNDELEWLARALDNPSIDTWDERPPLAKLRQWVRRYCSIQEEEERLCKYPRVY